MNKTTENKKNQLLRTAFPATPAVDNYNQIFTPYPGISRLEYYTLQIYTARDIKTAFPIDADFAINAAVKLIQKIDDYIKNLDHEEAQIII